jgi:hypothetical protein
MAYAFKHSYNEVMQFVFFFFDNSAYLTGQDGANV